MTFTAFPRSAARAFENSPAARNAAPIDNHFHCLSDAQRIRRERRPLPSHDLVGINYRQWIAAVCSAEIAHRREDFMRAVCRVGVFIDLGEPIADELGQLQHEAHAGAALNWLSHLQAHDSDRHGVWARWKRWDIGKRVWWLSRRRHLLHGFLREARKYQAERAKVS